jgi:acyl phosphate:glycerol-3-phosphate acyltransferase
VPIVAYIAVGLAGYLLGSIPTGFLVAKAKGVDIRTVGSGNIGATNVFRYLGKPAGIFVLLVDGPKGWIAVVLLPRLLGAWLYPTADAQNREWLAICAGVCAVLGHNYTCWLNFKGGKGIATSAGVLVALVPWSLVIILTIWILVFALSRYVSLASICASFALPFAAWLTKESLSMILVTAGMAVLAIYKHKANIQRLMNGTENRLGRAKQSPPASTA